MLRFFNQKTLGLFFIASAKKPKTQTRKILNQNPDVYQQYVKRVESDSILKDFRRQVFRRSEIDEQLDGIQKKIDNTQQELQNMLSEGSKEEILDRATKIGERYINKKNVYDLSNERSLLSDYGNYTSYNKVYAAVDDRNLGSEQFINDDSQIHSKLYKFIDKLPDEYEEKQNIKKRLKRRQQNYLDLSICQLGQAIQDQADLTAIMTEGRRVDSHLYNFNKTRISGGFENPIQTHQYTGIHKSQDPSDGGGGINGTLSPDATSNIYQLYIQGWTVRQISKRYGILPARTKFCIWSRAQLYHEIIPKMGVKYFIECTRRMFDYHQSVSFCDYGLDLEDLSSQGVLQSINEWCPKMLDAQRKQESYDYALQKLQDKKIFNKYQMVEVGTAGKQNKMYKLKQWHIFRGKGSDEYFLKNKTFRKLSKAQRKFNKEYY